MDLPKVLSGIKSLIGEGNIEQAMEQLVALLDSDPLYSELAQVARVNQGELYQVKAQVIRGTIAPETAQLATNQVTDNALQIIRRFEAGQYTFQDNPGKPTRSQAWRYYVLGGLVTLLGSFAVWYFTHRNAHDTCPKYDANTRFKVMILPFKQTGDKKASDPAVDIADGLNVLFSKTASLKDNAVADVNERYNIEKNYPSLTEATDLAQGCGVQMIVWGKINESTGEGYKLDIRYKLLDGTAASTGDTSLSNLLKMNDSGSLFRDVEAGTRLLYIVLANWANAPIAANLLNTSQVAALTDTAAPQLPDSTLLLQIARSHVTKHETVQALATYDQVLTAYPGQPTALRMRGALQYQQGEFAKAASDLELAAPDVQSADPSLQKIRAESFVKSGQPAKATQDLNSLRRRQPKDGAWINNLEKEAAKVTQTIEQRLVAEEKMAAKRPNDPKLQAQAARSNLALGQTERALGHAKNAIKADPKAQVAYEIAVDANLQKGDTVSAQQVLQTARQNGIDVKGVERWRPLVDPLSIPRRNNRRN